MNFMFVEVNLPNSTLTQRRKVSQQEYFSLVFSGRATLIPKKTNISNSDSLYYQLKKRKDDLEILILNHPYKGNMSQQDFIKLINNSSGQTKYEAIKLAERAIAKHNLIEELEKINLQLNNKKFATVVAEEQLKQLFA
jgi:hypothetical protein